MNVDAVPNKNFWSLTRAERKTVIQHVTDMASRWHDRTVLEILDGVGVERLRSALREMPLLPDPKAKEYRGPIPFWKDVVPLTVLGGSGPAVLFGTGDGEVFKALLFDPKLHFRPGDRDFRFETFRYGLQPHETAEVAWHERDRQWFKRRKRGGEGGYRLDQGV